MVSILFYYFFAKVIGIILLLTIVVLRKKRKINFVIYIVLVIFASLINFFQYLEPNIVSNIKLYNSLVNLKPNQVSQIVYLNNGTNIKSHKKLNYFAEFLKKVKRNKFYYGNKQIRLAEYEVEIFLKNNEKIRLRIVETENLGTLIYLQNIFNNNYYNIAVYKNDNMSSILSGQ